MTTVADRQAALERMDRERRDHNAGVRNRQYCRSCSTSVRDRDYDWKFMAAGGILEGPFCSRGCHFAFLLEESDSDE